ncbi:MAG: peptide ABC transporter ATP-binding protein [Pelagibacterium sp. SCN 63-23]|nr:MAG: peptide ABC transporter ATP-binding protein [Pelagibacterium sp. SCN 63-23]
MVDAPAIELKGVKVHFASGSGRSVRAVDGVYLTVPQGVFHGIVGESGCGKTTLARAIIGLQPTNEGSIAIAGRPLADWQARDRKGLARQMQFVFQDPLGSLSRRQSIEQSLEEPLIIHRTGNSAARHKRVLELLDLVGLPQTALGRTPRSLSGGQRQRVAIARALALEPKILVCDEPLSALDVSIRAQIVALFAELQKRLGLTIVMIAHDLAIVREICTSVSVMYLGRVAEAGTTASVFADAAHPYSQALLSAVPSPDPVIEANRRRVILAGDPPSPSNPPPGCRFNTRCPLAFERCLADEPVLMPALHGGGAACHLSSATTHGQV